MDDRDIVKSKVDMVALVGEVVELKKSGANWKGRCPFHGEKTPSFMVNPEMGIFKCFGCGEGGDCFSWLMKIEGMSFGESLKFLANKVGVQLSTNSIDKSDQDKQQILACLSKASEFYKYLLNHKIGTKALDYLHNRGITSRAIKTFGIGYAPDEWSVLYTTLRKSGFTDQIIDKSGLVAGEGVRKYDRFRARIVFELRNVRGQVLGLSGRLIEKNDQSPKYINSPETAVYHKGQMVFGLDVAKNSIRKNKRIIVVEGEMDVISSWQAGVEEVVALKGTAFTEDQVRLITRYTDKVVLALDMDLAGDKAARKSIGLLHQAGVDIRMAVLPQGKDPDDVARQDVNLWKDILDNAVEVYKFMLDSAVNRYDLKTAIGKQRMIDELVPTWREIPNDILRSHWISELARIVDISEAVISRKILSKFESKISYSDSPSKTDQKREMELEELIIAWIVTYQNLNIDLNPDDLICDWTKQVMTKDPEAIFDWQNQFDDDIKEKLSMAIIKMKDLMSSSESKIDIWTRELQEIKLKKIRKLKRKILKSMEEENNIDQISLLSQEIMNIDAKLLELRSS